MAWNIRTWLFGETITASKMNEIRDALLACGPGKVNNAGEIPVATGANLLSGLTAPSDDGLVLLSDMTKPEKMAWVNNVSALSFNYFNNTATHSYANPSWRDMPNSSKTITIANKSTIFCLGSIYEYGTYGETYAFFEGKFNIDGTDIDVGAAKRNYGIGHKSTLPIWGYKTGVAAGDVTIKLREICNAGQYTIEEKSYLVVVLPE